MTTPAPSAALSPSEFEALVIAIRPELHRYATRMTGSVIDGEDVVQEALVKAYASLALLTHQTNVRGWLFRITHNKAIDHLRRHHHETMEMLDEYPMTDNSDWPLESKELATIALSVFLKLAPRQRSCVILKDVLGYSLAEISELIDATVPEIKATLHRGRTRLRALAADAEAIATRLDEREQVLLAHYVDHFNARDFDALRALLTDEVRLDLVNRTKLTGAAEIADNYFYNYALVNHWRFAVGTVEDRPAVLGYDMRQDSAEPTSFILLTWENGRVTNIRDFLYAPYVMEDAAITVT